MKIAAMKRRAKRQRHIRVRFILLQFKLEIYMLSEQCHAGKISSVMRELSMEISSRTMLEQSYSSP